MATGRVEFIVLSGYNYGYKNKNPKTCIAIKYLFSKCILLLQLLKATTNSNVLLHWFFQYPISIKVTQFFIALFIH